MLVEIGGLDESFYAYNEDIDLSFRAQLQGYQCQYVPAAVVYHHVSGSFEITSSDTIGRMRRNMIEVLVKNMPLALLLKYLPSILAYYIAGDIYYCLRGHAKAILRARWQNLMRLPATMSKRQTIQQSKRVSTHQLERMLTTSNWRAIVIQVVGRHLQRCS